MQVVLGLAFAAMFIWAIASYLVPLFLDLFQTYPWTGLLVACLCFVAGYVVRGDRQGKVPRED